MRDINIDCLKGFAIFCVVIGHILQISLPDYDHNIIFRFIYSFHMPLFFFLSGYVNYKTKASFSIPFLKKRFISLMIPFFSWSIISILIYNSKIESILNKFIYPDTGYWFLPILFYSMIVLAISSYNRKFDIYILSGFSIIFIALDINYSIKYFGFNLLAKCFPFFVLGYFISEYKDRFLIIDRLLWKFFMLFFFIGIAFWMRKEPPLFYTYINFGSLFSFGYKFAVAILGIFFFFGLFRRFLSLNISKLEWLQLIGRHSLTIYLIHFFFLRFFEIINIKGFYYFNILLFGILSIGLCLGINYLISLNQPLSFILLGKSAQIKSERI